MIFWEDMNSDVIICPRTLLKMLYLTVIKGVDTSMLAVKKYVPAHIYTLLSIFFDTVFFASVVQQRLKVF